MDSGVGRRSLGRTVSLVGAGSISLVSARATKPHPLRPRVLPLPTRATAAMGIARTAEHDISRAFFEFQQLHSKTAS